MMESELDLERLRRDNEALNVELAELRRERQIVADSKAMHRLLRTVIMAAGTGTPVLLQGEPGTGKELLARMIHEESERRAGPFVQLDCAALPAGLLESALFGHSAIAENGSTNGGRVEGAIEKAKGGTLVLEEIGELRRDLQDRLLRVLQDQTLGGSVADVRLVATTSRDLTADVEAGRFSRELFYRMSVLPLVLPPLRERLEDISRLVCQFATRTARELGKEVFGLSAEALSLLQEYDWPGNVRELRHAVERAVMLATRPVLDVEEFDQLRFRATERAAPNASPPRPHLDVASAAHTNGATRPDANVNSDGNGNRNSNGNSNGNGNGHGRDAVHLTTLNVAEAERILIRAALERTGNNRTQAAKLLGMSVRTLRAKLNGRGS